MPPRLTLGRWTALMAIKEQPELHHRPFAARELKVMHRGAKRRPASGATMLTLYVAGWVRKVAVSAPDTDAPFAVLAGDTAWQVTEEGRRAIAACPEEYPGDPVYGNQT